MTLRDDSAKRAAPVAAPSEWTELKSGDMVGPYRIEKLLDRGGMASVFVAARNDNPKLKAALKTLVDWTPDTHNLFQAECKILSGLTHPGIAQLLDTGELPDGRPWMALEYVVGQPLDTHILRRELSLKDRLLLFLEICDAVSYTHSRLIIHRDLKPNNILVTPAGAPKLLDFGIASSLSSDTGVEVTQPLGREAMLTLGYASPEQARGEALSVASDVYGLGVMLYEMLAEISPYAGCRSMPLEEAVRQARIPRPSNARHPQSDNPTGFGAQLRGDLDTIVLKALERDLKRRYDSVETLAADLRHHLEGRPISARPASLAHRLSRFIARNS